MSVLWKNKTREPPVRCPFSGLAMKTVSQSDTGEYKTLRKNLHSHFASFITFWFSPHRKNALEMHCCCASKTTKQGGRKIRLLVDRSHFLNPNRPEHPSRRTVQHKRGGKGRQQDSLRRTRLSFPDSEKIKANQMLERLVTLCLLLKKAKNGKRKN